MQYSPAVPREELYIPDRFEGLKRAGRDVLRTIIIPVDDGLATVDRRFAEMRAANRGALVILRGETGAGKSTFLDTVGLFRDSVVTERVPVDIDVPTALGAAGPTDVPRLLVLEGREALGSGSAQEVEQTLHSVNSFVRSDAGRDTLIVWPTNADDLTSMITEIGGRLGGDALFGVGDPVERFSGPPKEAFGRIAELTIQALNDGASLAALGISAAAKQAMAEEAITIGHYLGLVRTALLENHGHLHRLMEVERYRMWTVVIAGNDPENDVAAVTRSSQSYVDIDRLMSATEANVVKELKKQPAKLGILGTSLDARILHMDMVTVLSVVREYGDERLHALMQRAGMSTTPSAGASASERLESSELGRLLAADSLGTRKRGSRPGGGTETAFAGLAQIARNNDALVNRAIGEGLKQIGLVEDYEVEKDLGTDLRFTSDLFIVRSGEPIRLEVMWRGTTGRAAIANYVLGKLRNYGKGIGYLD